MANAPAVRETSALPTASARRYRHHRGERVDAHGRRRGAPGQKQKDSQASGIGDTRRDHRTAQQNEKFAPAFEGATGRRTKSVTVEHEKGSSKAKLGTHKECDGCCRRGENSGGHENCVIKRNTNATKVSDEGTGRVTGCDGGRRKAGNSGGHENCASRQNTNATKVSDEGETL
jgi:hypothetical protein